MGRTVNKPVCRPISLADMTLITTFFLVVSVVFVFGQFLPTDSAKNDEVIEEELVLWRDRDRQQRQEESPEKTKAKVLDFSADNDGEPDNNEKYTSATLKAGPLPESFTICSAFRVEEWTTKFVAAYLFTVLNKYGYPWGSISLYAGPSFTQYRVGLGHLKFTKRIKALFFPLHWTRACLSVDSMAGKVRVVEDEQLLGEEIYDMEKDVFRPDNFSLLLGYDKYSEYTGQISEFNIFNSSLSAEKMIGLTTAGGEECGAPGDLVNWEEAEWTLHSQAKMIEVESQVKMFMANFQKHEDCMHHCKKIRGRSPSVITEDCWENFSMEIDLITQNISDLPPMWLSATEGDKGGFLGGLDHWPETEIVDNETIELKAE